MTSRIKWVLLGLLLGGIFLAVSLRGLDLAAVVEVLRQMKFVSAAAAVLATVAFMLLKAWRWSVILQPGISARFGMLHAATYMGSAANLVIVHSGELLRAMVVGRRAHAPPSAILASVGIERIFDMVAVLSYLGILVLFDRRLPEALVTAALVAGALVAVGLLVIAALLKPARQGRGLRRRIADVLPRRLRDWVVGELKRGLLGLGAVSRPRTLAWTYALSLVQWTCIVAAVWFSVASVGYPVNVSAAIGVWVLMVLGLTLPSSPAQLGTTQLAFTLGLALTAAQDEVAFAASLVYICTVNVPIMLIGCGYWLASEKAGLRPRGPGAFSVSAVQDNT